MAETLTNRVKSLEKALESRDHDYEIASMNADFYQESYNTAVQAMLQLDNVGWNQLTGYNTADDGLQLDEIKKIRELLQEWTDTNPLLWNGWDSRCAYVFGNGYDITTKQNSGTVPARAQAIIDKPSNQEVLFSNEALRTNEKERYTSGLFLVKYDKKKQEFSRLNLGEIEQVVIDPDNPERIWYYYRHYTRDVINFTTGNVEPKEVKVWYRTDKADTYNAPTIKAINGILVDTDIVVVDDVINRKAGNTFGIPDAFPAAPWALAYSAYLRDGTKVMAALAEWAFQFKPKNKVGGTNAGAAIRNSGADKGGIAITDGDLTPMPKAGQVNLGEGRPIASQVASALGVSVMILLMDVGSGGSFGAAETLSDPGMRIMEARQVVNGEFLQRCLKLIGLDAKVIWGKIAPDADYREQQTLNGALGSGLFYADEIRGPLAKVANIDLKHDGAPDGFLLPNNSNSWQLTTIDPNETVTSTADGTPQTGKAAPAKGASTVKADGTTSLTNGQGKDTSAKPSSGVNDLRGTGGRSK